MGRAADRAAAGRWAVVAAVVGALIAVPAVLAARSTTYADADADSGADLLARALHSSDVTWSGYAEATGRLALPDVAELGDLGERVGGTTRLRVWWRSGRDWRVDALSVADEQDTYGAGAGAVTWDSGDQRATTVRRDPALRLPRPLDLVPATLARRLLAGVGTAESVSRGGVRRVAGVEAPSLVVDPRDSASTVGRLQVWVEPRTGLPLELEITARGQTQPSLRTRVLDLDLSRPPATLTRFQPPSGASQVTLRTTDLAAAIDKFSPFELPARLAGLPRRERAPGVGGRGGVGTYGDGLTLLAVLPLPDGQARSLLRRLGPPAAQEVRPSGGSGVLVSTALVSVLVVTADADRRSYALAGAVAPAVLQRAADELFASPPPVRFGVEGAA